MTGVVDAVAGEEIEYAAAIGGEELGAETALTERGAPRAGFHARRAASQA